MTIFTKDLNYTVNSHPSIGENDETLGNKIVDLVGVCVQINAYRQDEVITVLEFAEYHQDNFTLEVGLIANTLLPVTSLTNSSNPFSPTVSIGGVTLISNPSTTPGTTELAKSSFYVHYLDTGITGANWIDLYNFSFDLDFNGGTWSLTSRIPLYADGGGGGVTFTDHLHASNTAGPIQGSALANLGKEAVIFGLKGSTTDFGPIVSDAQTGWVSKGIFGSAILHRNMAFLAYGRVPILTNQFFDRLNNKKETVVTMAYKLINAVNGVAGTHLTIDWRAIDLPLPNSLRVDGMTVLDALAALAGMVGAVLRWNGDDKYLVTYPNVYIGKWEVPDPRLLTSAGLSYLQHLDLATGISKAGLYYIPMEVIDKKTFEVPADTQPMTVVYQTTHKMGPDDPAVIRDLPPNYDKVYLQILLKEGKSTSGTSTIALQNFITTNPDEFFEFNIATLSGTVPAGSYKGAPRQTSYIFNRDQGGTLIPTLAIDYKVFPNGNDTVDADEFTLTFTCTKKDLKALFDQQKKDLEDQIKANILNQFEPSKFVKVYSGTFTCQFFGTIPMPGMWGKATIPQGARILTLDPLDPTNIITSFVPGGDMTVEGVIENVQFNYPGTLTITVAQYARIDFLASGNRALTVPQIGVPI